MNGHHDALPDPNIQYKFAGPGPKRRVQGAGVGAGAGAGAGAGVGEASLARQGRRKSLVGSFYLATFETSQGSASHGWEAPRLLC